MTHYDSPEAVIADAEKRMAKAVDMLTANLAKLRTGRASTGLLEPIKVDYYGVPTPLNQLAVLSTPDARTIQIQPFDPSTTQLIEKAIMESDLGLTPTTTGEGGQRIIRIHLPELSEERRKELVRVARKEAEEGRVAVRNVRRDANEAIKRFEKAGELSEDEARRLLDRIQKLTDRFVAEIDRALEQKERDLLSV